MVCRLVSSLVPRPSAIISVGGKDGLVYTVRACTNFPPKVGERKLTRLYIICKSQLRQWLLRRLQRTGYSLSLCRTLFLALDFLVSRSSKNSCMTAICYLYQRKDVFLWLPTGLGKSVCYEVLPFLFDFAGSKSGNIVSRWTELLLGTHVLQQTITTLDWHQQ